MHGSKMGPSWGHVGLQNRPERVQERKKTTPKTRQETSSKNAEKTEAPAITTRSGAESKWPPQGGLGGAT